MAGKGQDIDTTVVVDRIVPGPSVAWSEDSRAPEAKSKEGQDATIASNPSDKGASGASTAARRRRPATSLEKDSRSTTSSSSNATRRWINFPHDRLLAFGVSNFEETSSAGWSWDEDIDRNPYAESFVCEDEKDVLRHMNYLGGLCLRQDIRGPIGLELSSELSHRNVPEFSTFWSSTPVTASLSKKSIKVLLLILAVGFTYMADLTRAMFLLRGNKFWTVPFMTMRGVVLDITTDPRDAHLQTRRPMELAKIGAVVGRSAALFSGTQTPYGFVDHLVANYTVVERNHHWLICSQPVDVNTRYWELKGRHPSKTHYWAFLWFADVWLVDSKNSSGDTVPWYEEEEENSTPRETMDKYTKIYSTLQTMYRAMSYKERLDNDLKFWTIDKWDHARWIRSFVRVDQGWDGRERIVQHDGMKDRQIIGLFIHVSIAISAWLALIHSLRGNTEAAKKSILLIIACSSLSLLVLIALDLETLSEAEDADSWESIALGVHNNLCCASRPDIELDTEAGRRSRKALMRDFLAVLVGRFLQVLSAPFMIWALWTERLVLLNSFCFFGAAFIYHGIVLPVVAPQGFGAMMVLISGLGFLFPLFVWWRLASIRRSVTKLINEDVVAWEQLYSEIMARPSSQMQLERIIQLSKRYEKKEMRQMTRVDEELSSALLVKKEPSSGVQQAWKHVRQRVFKAPKGERQMRDDKLCEPIRSIDQLYLQAKTMVPYLSRLVQVWANQSDGMFRVERIVRTTAARAADSASVPAEAWEGGPGTRADTESVITSSDSNTASATATASSDASDFPQLSTASVSLGSSSDAGPPAAACAPHAVPESSPASLEQAGDRTTVDTAHDTAGGTRRSVLPAMQMQGETRTFTFEKWRGLQHQVESGSFSGKIAFAKLKLIPRIIEKTQRCYKGDASQLTDLCRAAVAFESLEDLANCLELMLNDNRIEVHRIKNRLDPNYKIATTHGYRDVNVNFRVVKSPLACLSEAEWLRLGLSEHVCEMQLVPIEYFRVKTEEGHKKYIQYRNMQAE